MDSEESVAALLDGLPTEALLALQELMAAVELDPWGVAGRDPDRDGNMPNVAFGPRGQGQVSLLILDGPRQVWVTQVQWAG
jgi:hypothetical protein